MPSVKPTLPPTREIADVATLKALSDPLRLALLRTLMQDAADEPRVMSVKELARELGEPQTRLYRHVQQLEAAGLIQVAQTRLVSGITEHRYQAAQITLRLSPDLIHDTAGAGHVAAAVGVVFDDFRRRLLGSPGSPALSGSDPAPTVVMLDTRLTPERAAQFQQRLRALVEEYDGADEDPAASVPVDFLMVLAVGAGPDPAG
jgi:DNA-binding transcriptional ArsR family regulator